MESNQKKSWFRSAGGMHCPKCREGKLFPTATFSFEKPFTMHERCKVCDQNFTPEPGFYFGAMFISYIIWGWFSILLCLPLVFIFEWSVNQAFALLIFISAICFVWLFRISRSLWIHAMVRYRRKEKK